jgi:pantoate--beta-alanine ligase
MQTCHDSSTLRAQVAEWKQASLTVALVPTMGNLHAGHISLVERARQEADRVVVSIFVNPTQFGPGEDFASYPRTLDADSEKLTAAHTDLLFAPSVDVMYPRPNLTWVDIEQLGEHLCGANRPGHFRGVCTVVSKLFNLVQPDVACFGEKDFQQLAIIRRMTADLCFPIRIVGVPTHRAESGLALSSRNGYLNDSERSHAAHLQQLLRSLKARIEAGERDYASLQAEAGRQLQADGFDVDYVAIMNADSLTPATPSDSQLLLALAARLGNTRLIDNIPFNIECDR